eukprot:5260691-Pyramimonas_sp.AAC.1
MVSPATRCPGRLQGRGPESRRVQPNRSCGELCCPAQKSVHPGRRQEGSRRDCRQRAGPRPPRTLAGVLRAE